MRAHGHLQQRREERNRAHRGGAGAAGLSRHRDPAAGLVAGGFENADLQAVCNALVTSGQASLVAALGVGALIEETDIRDLRPKMAQTDEADVLRVSRNVLCGS